MYYSIPKWWAGLTFSSYSTLGSTRSREFSYTFHRGYTGKKGGMGSISDQVCLEAKSIVVPHSYAKSSTGSLILGAFVVKSEHKPCLWQKHPANCLPCRASISFFASFRMFIEEKRQLNYQPELNKGATGLGEQKFY